MSLLTGLEAALAEKLMHVLAAKAPKMKDEMKAKLTQHAVDFLTGKLSDSKHIRVTNAPDKIVIEIDKNSL